jgi:hypothetical protein
MYPDRLLRFSRRVYSKFQKNIKPKIETDNYFGKVISSMEAGNKIIQEKIQDGSPLMISRIGHTELTIMRNYFEIQELKEYNPIKKFIEEVRFKDAEWSDDNRSAIHTSSGFFPVTSENLYKFCEIYFEALTQIDVLGVWNNYFEDELAHRFCKNASLIPLQSLEPYYFSTPWSIELKGKNILVIHPFEDSILKQFAQKDKLFDDPNILPAFNLQTIKAVQGVVHHKNDFASWFDAFQSMKEEIDKRSFDIALIGAGAYGLPLAAHIKRRGKQAIHIGGALQILFGIKGSRWDSVPAISKFYNANWTRPLPEETPEKHKEFEGGKGYW